MPNGNGKVTKRVKGKRVTGRVKSGGAKRERVKLGVKILKPLTSIYEEMVGISQRMDVIYSNLDYISGEHSGLFGDELDKNQKQAWVRQDAIDRVASDFRALHIIQQMFEASIQQVAKTYGLSEEALDKLCSKAITKNNHGYLM